jgi:hypothetical protein
MKVIYREPILERIKEAIRVASIDGKGIEKFVLSVSEFEELRINLSPKGHYGSIPGIEKGEIFGIKFEVLK